MPKPVQRVGVICLLVGLGRGCRFRLSILVQLLLCLLLGFRDRGRLRALALANLDGLRSFCLAAPLLRLRLGTLLRFRRRRRGRPLCSEFVIVVLERPRIPFSRNHNAVTTAYHVIRSEAPLAPSTPIGCCLLLGWHRVVRNGWRRVRPAASGMNCCHGVCACTGPPPGA